ncbi:hypothetical protein [Nonomuraea candida]|uniref:hypothetical protein n=1 Tax=Nonomuraea candida TaxID=359159 RepID=UPI0005BC348D|nr:hypothetical protein [Nonomuraea candida]
MLDVSRALVHYVARLPRLLRALRCLGERGFALLKGRWRSLQHFTASPSAIDDIARAALVHCRAEKGLQAETDGMDVQNRTTPRGHHEEDSRDEKTEHEGSVQRFSEESRKTHVSLPREISKSAGGAT